MTDEMTGAAAVPRATSLARGPWRLFIAGPGAGEPAPGRDAYDRAQAELEGLGYRAVNPCGMVPAGPRGPESVLGLALECDCVALLDGWERDKLALTVRGMADCCGKPCHSLERWMRYAEASRLMGVWPW